jgi:hypothetical protein
MEDIFGGFYIMTSGNLRMHMVEKEKEHSYTFS